MGWYYLFRDRHFQFSPTGTRDYAERAATVASAEMTARLLQAQSPIHALLADGYAITRLMRQKWNKLRDFAESDAPGYSRLTPEEYEHLRVKVRNEYWVYCALVLGESFLTYLSLLIIIPSNLLLLVVARTAIALVFTLMGFAVFSRFFRAWHVPVRMFSRTSDPKGAHIGAEPVIAKWSATILAVALLIVVASISVARARDFEGGETGIGIVGLGLIIASMLLPVVGGKLESEREELLPAYRVLRKWRQALIDLRKLEARLGQMNGRIDRELAKLEVWARESALRYYGGVIHFRSRKQVRDLRRGQPVEPSANTFAGEQTLFVEKALQPFRDELRTVRAAVKEKQTLFAELLARSIELRRQTVFGPSQLEPDGRGAVPPIVQPEEES